MSRSGRLPDFIIIGAMKSATSTLHKQLSGQHGIFMSTPKEPNFFSDDAVYARGLDWYQGLFSEAPDDAICGESSTHYTKLPDYPRTIERLKSAIPNPKLIYVMRDPIERLISHYIHQWSEGVISCDINTAIDRYPELINYSCYGMQIRPFIEAFGEASIMPIFFHQLKAAQQSQLEAVGRFIGVTDPASLRWDWDNTQDNISGKRIRKFYGYNLMMNSPLLVWLRRKLVPQSLRDHVKGYLRMEQRPAISEAQLIRITAIFDQDFKQLSDWLGFELTCLSFNQAPFLSAQSRAPKRN